MTESADQPICIGFLFNHEAAHQVPHIAPVIAAFRQHYPHVQVVALVSSDEQRVTVEAIVQRLSGDGFACVRLRTPDYLSRLFSLTNTIVPLQRLYLLRKFRSLFQRFDCLIVPEMTSARLKSRLGTATTALVLLPHGAGDRAVGFCKEIKEYDFVLLSGAKVRDRMLAAGLITAGNHRVVGYPKFDGVALDSRTGLFDNDRPTVLYNPHFDPHLSSWYDMGAEVCAYFADNGHYNLMVAPHVMLFKRRLHISLESNSLRVARRMAERYKKCANIKFDPGSSSSIDMRYTLNSDIYLGDVSSQVYEFLQRPRPCIFFNSHNAEWRHDENYGHWHFGPVLQSVAALGATLATIEESHGHFIEAQRRAFAETFDLSEVPSSVRAARAVIEFLASRGQRAPVNATDAAAIRHSDAAVLKRA